jgi:hypothetical protein
VELIVFLARVPVWRRFRVNVLARVGDHRHHLPGISNSEPARDVKRDRAMRLFLSDPIGRPP